MSIDVLDRSRAAAVCAADGMPLYPTIVGPRCALCGASTPR